MGTHALPVFTRRLPWMLLVAAAGWLAGCSEGHKKEISSGQFLAPVSEGAGSITVLADNMTFLQSIRPDSPPEDLENIRPDSFVVGRLSSHDEATSKVEEIDEYLIYESKTRSLLSATRCTGSLGPNCSKVLLHYDGRGFDDALEGRLGASVSSVVEPLKLQNGWIIGFDDGNQGIVAFRKEAPRIVAGEQVIYRAFQSTGSKNFGAGNGLLVSQAVGAEELQAKVGNFRISHMVEIEPNKVLVFFLSDLEDVHLLELTEEEVFLPFDLDLNPEDATGCDPQAEPLCLPVKRLKGTIKLFPDPAAPAGRAFLPISQITDATGATTSDISVFQPFCLTSCAGDALPCDRLLLYEGVTATFLDLTVVRNAGALSGGIVRRWTSAEALAVTIGEANSSPPVNPPYRFNAAYCDPTTGEISIFEENTNSLVLLDSNRAAPEDNLRPLIGKNDILFRRDPSGKPKQVAAPAEPELVFSGPDMRLNRVYFDQGSKELQSVNYETGVVVLVSSPLDVNEAINATGNFVFLDPNPSQDEDIRIFDQQTNSLINLKVKYSTLPVRVD